MWGAEGLTRAAATNLRAGLPPALARIRTKYGLSLDELPAVEAIYPTPRDFASVNEFPCIMLAAQNTEGRLDNRQVEATEVYDEFELLYRLRAMVYCMGTSYDVTELLVQRTLLATREALLSDRVYGDPNNGEGGVLDPRQLRESYADTVGPSEGGFLGAAWVEIGVRSSERLTTNLPSRPVDVVTSRVGVTPTAEIHPGLL